MKNILVLTIIFLILTILLLNKDYKKGKLLRKSYLFILLMEGIAILLSMIMVFVI